MSRAANLKREGKESTFARRKREKEELDRMLERNIEETETRKEAETETEVEARLAEETRRMMAAKAVDQIDEVPEAELLEQIGGNTKMIRELTGQIGALAGGVKVLVDTMNQHDQVLANHGRRISALEKEAGIIDGAEEQRVTPDSELVQRETEAKPEHYGYLYFPVDKNTGKTRWDLPFSNSVDAADLAISCSWQRRLFCFNPEGRVIREATPEEASKFSCGGEF